MTNDMSVQSAVEIEVMKRVHRIRVLRLIISGTVFAASATLLALYALGREVWVARVFQNGPQTFSGHLLYLIYAFEHTRFMVEVLLVVCVVAFIYLAYEAVKALREF